MSLREKIYDLKIGTQVSAGTEQTTLVNIALSSRPTHNIVAGGTQSIPSPGASFGNDKAFLGVEYGMSEFQVIMEPVAAAGDVPSYGALLTAASFSETVNAGADVTYAVALTGATVATIKGHHDTNEFKYVDSTVNKLSLSFSVNQLPMMDVGIISQAATLDENATPVVPDYTLPKTVQTNVTTLEIDSQLYCFNQVTLDYKIATTSPEDLVCPDPIEVLDMPATLTANIKDAGQAVHKWETMIGGDPVPVNIVHGVAGGNRITVATASAQLVNVNRNETINGLVGVGLEFNILKGAIPTITID